MSEPLPLETIESEFDESYEAWVLQEETSGMCVVIPHKTFPGRRPIHFFMKREDAEAVLQELLEENVGLRGKEIYPVKVRLLRALRGIARDTTPGNADAFVVHTPNEVYEWLRDRAEFRADIRGPKVPPPDGSAPQ